MIIQRLTELGIYRHPLLYPIATLAHQKSCPAAKPRKVCPGSGAKPTPPPPTRPKRPNRCSLKRGPRAGGGGGGGGGKQLVRAKTSGKCRMGFIPEEWFTFLHSKTGVSGPYILMFGLANYAASKEILVMEHEYYSGLSVALVLYLLISNFGRQIGAALDKEVDGVHADFQRSRDQDIANQNYVISEAKLAQTRAQGQEILMAAKKENITFQLEALYRERCMMVYRAVRGRLLYHEKIRRALGRIEQRWMVQWILENVNKSITPQFQQEALKSAIRDLAKAAAQAK